jgi:hypothetical protein
MSILKLILAEKPVREGLPFGIQENVALTAISNEKRMKDGEMIRRNTYLTFTQYNDDKRSKKIRQSTFSYFDLDPAKPDMLMDNLSTQIAQLVNIVSVIRPDFVFNPLEGVKADTQPELLALLTSNKDCMSFTNTIFANFEKAISEHLGAACPLMRLKVVTDKNNRSTQLPKDGIIVEPITKEVTSLKMSAYEVSLSLKVPTASSPTADNSVTSSASGLISL